LTTLRSENTDSGSDERRNFSSNLAMSASRLPVSRQYFQNSPFLSDYLNANWGAGFHPYPLSSSNSQAQVYPNFNPYSNTYPYPNTLAQNPNFANFGSAGYSHPYPNIYPRKVASEILPKRRNSFMRRYRLKAVHGRP